MSFQGRSDYQTPEGLRVAPATELLADLTRRRPEETAPGNVDTMMSSLRAGS